MSNHPQAALSALLATQDIGLWSVRRVTLSDGVVRSEYEFVSDGHGIGNAIKAFRLIQSVKNDLRSAAIRDVQHFGCDVHVYWA
jgi:hypothetical protein